MLEKIKDKFKMFFEKIETAPWYIRIFIGSWVSLYTSVVIWFALTSWNPALYEGETVKLFTIYFLEYIAYCLLLVVWLFYLINVQLKLKQVFNKVLKVIFHIVFIFILLGLFVIYTPYYWGFGNFLLYGYKLNSLALPKLLLTHENQEDFSYKRDFIQSTRYYNNRLFYYNYNFIGYLNSDFLKTYESDFDRRALSTKGNDITLFYNGLLDDMRSNDYIDIYSYKHLNNIDIVTKHYINAIENNNINYSCRFYLLEHDTSWEEYKPEFINKEETLVCLDLIDYYVHLHTSIINYIYLLKEQYKTKITEKDLEKRKIDILSILLFMQKNMPEDLQQLTDLNKLKIITKNI